MVKKIIETGVGNLIGVLTPSEISLSKLKKIDILCGAFCFNVDWIKKMLPRVKLNPKSGEYPLPAIIKASRIQGLVFC